MHFDDDYYECPYYHSHRPTVTQTVTKYKMSLDHFRELLGITETGTLTVITSNSGVTVAVRS